MTVITCDLNECLNHGKEVCLSQRIHIDKYAAISCTNYVTAEDLSRLSIPDIERSMLKL